ncbi:Fic family protein [Ralstonia pseudosolanacearum]|uniref:Fic family protein n=1 Tax=Ralstonia pseudosolanacearum TaxID=1310165 RepID=UPI003AAA913E
MAVKLARQLDLPMAARGPITYRPEFVENYIPNESWLMLPGVSAELARLGALAAPRGIGAYADQVLSDLLVDLSWNSSRLEGNHYSAPAAAVLLNGGARRCDVDTVMLLNHRAAIEFLADSVSQEGLSALVLRNVHAILMRDLVASSSLGAIRKKPLGIAGTLYSPMQEPDVIEAMLDSIVEKAVRIENPVEAALFLWIQLAYLQPFESGNELTSRLAANIPLLLQNCAPLTFLDVTRDDYARAMLAVYELRDTTLAAELLSWTYQRSTTNGAAARGSGG